MVRRYVIYICLKRELVLPWLLAAWLEEKGFDLGLAFSPMGDVPENDAPYPAQTRTSPNLLQRRGTFETITNVFAGAEQTLGGDGGWASRSFSVKEFWTSQNWHE